MRGFTIRQAELLTGFSRENLVYLTERNLIAPQKFGRGISAIYGLNQIVQLKLIYKIRSHASLQSMGSTIGLVVANQQSDRLKSEERLVIVNNQAYWALPDLSNLPQFINIVLGQIYFAKLLIFPSPSSVLAEIFAIANQNQDLIESEALAAIGRSVK